VHRPERCHGCRALLPFLLLLPLAAGCKETEKGDGADAQQDDGSGVVAAKRSGGGLWAQDASYLQLNSDFYFRVWNDTFTRRLDDLPTTGQVTGDKMPRSGGYYAEHDGSTNMIVAGTRSPLQKYDEAFHGGQDTASQWERDKHTGGPAWAGHCNGWAAAAQRHPKEPSQSVVRNGVTFAPQDIKALLAEIYMNADYEFLGGRRCDDAGGASSPLSRQDPTVMADCEDTNPGTFHAAITNWVGRLGHVMIMDLARDEQVWNHPIVGYQLLAKETITADQARQYVVGSGGTYVFNPTAVRFAFVRNRVTYLEPTKRETLGQTFTEVLELSYVLEMDASGAIVGGEWTQASQDKHPDFVWVALEPLEPNGTRYMGNPHLDNGEVIKMWAESAGYDPANPPLDFKRPADSTVWGHFPGFDVVLDGNDRGAAFLGKEIHAHLKRVDTLAGAGVSVDVGLNGAPLKSLTATGNEDLSFAFDPGPGLNKLEFTFKVAGVAQDPQVLRFRAIR
jgi:hypothetical protein